jgi:hypothetical protein
MKYFIIFKFTVVTEMLLSNKSKRVTIANGNFKCNVGFYSWVVQINSTFLDSAGYLTVYVVFHAEY